MELKDFVKEVINQIGEAVTDFNGDNGNKRLVVTPACDSMHLVLTLYRSIDIKNNIKYLDVSNKSIIFAAKI